MYPSTGSKIRKLYTLVVSTEKIPVIYHETYDSGTWHMFYAQSLKKQQFPMRVHWSWWLRAAIHHFIPSTPPDSPHPAQKPEHLLEDHHQKEFYCSLYCFVDEKLLTSPEYVTKRGQNGGVIDFILPGPKWGIELIRDGNEIDEHMGRFESGGPIPSPVSHGPNGSLCGVEFHPGKCEKATSWYVFCHSFFLDNDV